MYPFQLIHFYTNIMFMIRIGSFPVSLLYLCWSPIVCVFAVCSGVCNTTLNDATNIPVPCSSNTRI